jgi:hypothetical protein
MSRPTTRIFFSGRFLDAPQGEAAYWAHLISTRAGVVTMTAAEKPNPSINSGRSLPYLGQVAQPDDRLAWSQIALNHQEII